MTTGLRLWWTLTGVTLLIWSFLLFGYVDQYPILTLAVIVFGLWGLATVAGSLYPTMPDRRWVSALPWITVGLVVTGFLLWSLMQIVNVPAYGTDEIAFDQYAAQLLVHGMNPYVHSMNPSFAMFHVSPNGYTFRLDGQPVTSLSYPALSFLVYTPFYTLGWSTQMAVVINVFAWAIGMVLAYVLLPKEVRPLALVLGSLSVYIGYAVGGVTDALFVPLLIGAVYQWDRYPTQRGMAALRSPVLLGLAMAVKQTPWLLLPFLAIGIWLEARRSDQEGWNTAGRFVGITALAFLIPNLPFIVLSPHAWASGILTPIASHAVPAGQGFVGLSLFLGIGGGSLGAYTLALIVVLIALVVIFFASYPSLKAMALVFPAVVLFFSARSFGSYLVTLMPVVIVGALSLRPRGVVPAKPAGSLQPRWVLQHIRIIVASSLVVSGVAIGAVVLNSPPLSVVIKSVETTGQLATIVQVGVEVVNKSNAPMTPHFSVESSGTISTFWIRSHGPSRLGPGQSAKYTLLAPNYFAQPSLTGEFQVVAFTADPGTVSRSDSYQPTLLHLSLVPDAINTIVPVGHTVHVEAQILNQFGRPVPLAGQPVYLGQIIYAQSGLAFGQAVINGGNPGQTPVVAYTNAHGTASFEISSASSTKNPVYFEANLVKRNFLPVRVFGDSSDSFRGLSPVWPNLGRKHFPLREVQCAVRHFHFDFDQIFTRRLAARDVGKYREGGAGQHVLAHRQDRVLLSWRADHGGPMKGE